MNPQRRLLPWLTAAFTLTAAAARAAPPAAAADVVLGDKTLVVWVVPANLSQRAGSVLTLNDGRDKFDAIVFGELAPAKWMAGSDYFRRTRQDQADVAEESAGPQSVVQVAIAYAGKQVTVFRNAQLYSQHTFAGEPQPFGPACRVSIGRREPGAALFAGTIDDARIYDRALSAEQLASLKPNVASSIQPWAWWSFNEAQPKDHSGRFLITELAGGAKVENGHLVLDGVAAELLASSGKEVPFSHETPAWPVKPPADWLTYHLAHPGPGEGVPGDPNCAFFWGGRYHLHYIYTHRDGFSFAHVSSPDMVHWKWHPTTLTPPKTGHGMFSGTGFFTKEGKPAIIYHGEGSGRNFIAFGLDENLDQWSRPMAIVPRDASGAPATGLRQWDPDCWLNGDTYYGINGGAPPYLMDSPDLKTWRHLGLLMHPDAPAFAGLQPDEDVSCANMFKIGNKWMLLCISHRLGCRYYLGDFKDGKYLPDFHAMMNWRAWEFFAPESLLTADGRRVMWSWCKLAGSQTGIQSLPRELSLPEDGVLRIKPLRELAALRSHPIRQRGISLRSEATHLLREMAGDTLELEVTIAPSEAKQYGIEVFGAAAQGKGLPITLNAGNRTLAIGNIAAPFELAPGEPLNLRVFLDKGMVEVFANERQALVYMHPHPPTDLAISLFTRGGNIVVDQITAWPMKSIYQPAP